MMTCRCCFNAMWLTSTGVAAAILLTGCGADLAATMQGSSVTDYQAASMFSPTGHSVAALADGRFRVTATGSPTTPVARVEKIAAARAAEFGSEQHKKFFQTSTPQASIRCGKREYLEKGEKKKLPMTGYSVVEIDVTYADVASDASFRPVNATAGALKAELQADVVAEEARNQSAAAVRAQCGG